MKNFFCMTGLVVTMAVTIPGFSASAQIQQSTVLTVDQRSIIAQADLRYETPVSRSEEGMPIGNGRMGTLVWTAPTTLKFQINRVDVFSNDSRTKSFIERHSDYCCGVGFVDVDFVDTGADVFPATRTEQHLSTYDGLLSVTGHGVHVKVLAWHDEDVIAIRVEDHRSNPAPVRTKLRMLRPAFVRTRSHIARSDFVQRDARFVLRQQFTESDYYDSSALAIQVVGRTVKAVFSNENEVVLTATAGKGVFTILISSASSFEKVDEAVTAALQQLDIAAEVGFDGLFKSNTAWWQKFWARSFIHLRSDDKVADFVEANYNYFLYLMASSSRGAFPPKFNGMLWSTGGDRREWGSQYWWHNVSSYYQGMLGTNRLELSDPVFNMYSGMYESLARAAQQQWGSQGIFIPEVTWFDGLAELPEAIAAEMQDLYLRRKPWRARSDAFRRFARTQPPHNSQWNWKAHGKWIDGEWTFTDKGAGPNGHVVHMLSSGAKIAYLYWERYQYTQDRNWLRERAYPMLKGVAELFQFFPNLVVGSDGKYHLHHVNNHEPVWGAQDTMEELAAMQGLLPLAIRAAELLGVDEIRRAEWEEILVNLTPLPTNDHPDSLDPRKPGMPRLWVNGLRPHAWGDGTNRDYHTIVPAIHYDLCTLETQDENFRQIANDSFESLFPDGIHAQTKVDSLSPYPRAAALLGRSEDVQILIPSQIGSWGEDEKVQRGQNGKRILRNRMSLLDGPQANDVERLGRVLDAVQLALLQAVPMRPGGDPVIRVFPAWPTDWDAEYSLLARGGFVVTSAIESGTIQFVEIKSVNGTACRVRNPWHGKAAMLYHEGKKVKRIKGPLFELSLNLKETVVLVREGIIPQRFKRQIGR